jgi:hypothetical protein
MKAYYEVHTVPLPTCTVAIDSSFKILANVYCVFWVYSVCLFFINLYGFSNVGMKHEMHYEIM